MLVRKRFTNRLLNKRSCMMALACLLRIFPASAQESDYARALTQMKLKAFSIETKTDTIYFLATAPDKRKKTIVFCTGSGPVPLITKTAQGLFPPFPFSIDSNTRKEFNVVIISKPGIKPFATEADVSQELLRRGQILQLDSLNQPPEKYVANNSLYKLAGDCSRVIKYLAKQPWVNSDSIYVFGHSQGALVAAYVAYKYPKHIKGLIYAQANAYGIYAEYLSTMLSYPIPPADIAMKIDSVYKLHDKMLKSGDGSDCYNENTGRWTSFENPSSIHYLLKTKMPILLINGLGSPGELDNKNIPLDFARNHKTNLTARFYAGYDHNFFKQVYDEKGNQQEPEFHWDDVFRDVKNWIKGIR